MAEEHGKRERHLRWLRDELPELVEREVLDGAAAQRIRAHYALGTLREPRNVALLIFGALGALLVGAGLILIIAHNWDQLGRPVRAAISIGLLVAAQGLAGFALWRHPRSAAWTESSALFLTLCTGASVALISQTYNIQGELGDFMLTWTALVVPAVYLLRARVSALVCLVLALFLPETRQRESDFGFSYLLVIGALAPYLALVVRRQAGQARTLLLSWGAALTIPIGLSMLLLSGPAGDAEDLALPFFSALFAASYLFGQRLAESGATRVPGFTTPFPSVGLLGALGFALVMTFDDPWPWRTTFSMARDLRELEVQVALGCSVLLAAQPLRAALAHLRARRFDQALLLGLPLLALVGAPLLALTGAELLVMLLGNAYALALGVALMLAGLSARSLRQTNIGLATLSVLFIARFLDAELSMIARGVAMVAVGIAFVGVNVWLVRRTRREEVHP